MRRSAVATALVAVLVSYIGAPAAVKAGGVIQTNLVSDLPGVAQNLDPDLVNPWGITHSTGSPFWVSDNGVGLSTLYNTAGTKQGLRVSIPGCPPADPLGSDGKPTGTVFNIDGGASGGFKVTANGKTGVTAFLFATEDGTIVGWAPSVDGTHGIIAVPENAGPENCGKAVYKGLAIATTTDSSGITHGHLYAANFQSGMVDTFDENFTAVNPFTGPNLGAGFSPFNVAVLGGKVYVAYAIRNPHTGDNVPGKGSGIVDVFDLDGNFLQRLAQGGHLKAPWGMAIAPANFGSTLGGKLWIGNFGDGHINVFDPETGAFIDQVRDTNGNPIVIDGLWGLIVGNGGNGGRTDTIYFTAGPNDEQHGLFGSLFPSP
jgi:uncharacterized protein (TIGR03118 family)